MWKGTVINGVTSYPFYLKKLREHDYDEAKTLLEIAGNFLEISDKKEPIGSLFNTRITIENTLSCSLDEIETEIKLERAD